MGATNYFGGHLYTDNLGINFRTFWGPQRERKVWVPILSLLKSEPKINFLPIIYAIFSTFHPIRCHSLSSLHHFPSKSVTFLSSFSSSFPLFFLSRVLRSFKQIFWLTLSSFHFIVVRSETLCSFVSFCRLIKF